MSKSVLIESGVQKTDLEEDHPNNAIAAVIASITSALRDVGLVVQIESDKFSIGIPEASEKRDEDIRIRLRVYDNRFIEYNDEEKKMRKAHQEPQELSGGIKRFKQRDVEEARAGAAFKAAAAKLLETVDETLADLRREREETRAVLDRLEMSLTDRG